MGGKLIREVVSALKQSSIQLPITSYILIGTSAGSDSTALATLIAKYGRRVVDPSKIVLIHINHGWRGAESDSDAEFVEALGKKLGVSVRIIVRKDKSPGGQSLEDHARQIRMSEFAKLTAEYGASTLVLTAHHSEDLAETLLWRFCTGAIESHGAGILRQHGNVFRPLLGIRKSALQSFLKEEKVEWREDRTNFEGRFLRSRIRLELMPVVEKLFPRSVDRLVEYGLSRSNRNSRQNLDNSEQGWLEALRQLQLRRPHWVELRQKLTDPKWYGEITLPQGWSLVRKRQSKKVSKSAKKPARKKLRNSN